jgi:hypothetical protein
MRLFKFLSHALILVWPTFASAKCEHGPIDWNYGGSVETTWVTDGSACRSRSRHPENVEKIVIETKPRHGVVGKDGPYGVAYLPNPGFKGEDSFSYTVRSNANFRLGAGVVARILVKVLVQ